MTTEIWACPPDWAAWLTGSLFGLFVAGGLGFWIRGFTVRGGPWEMSQTPPIDGPSGGL